MLTTKRLVELAGIGEDRLFQIEQAGAIKRTGRDRWPAIETLAGLVRFYRDENRRGPRGEAEAELRRVRTREVEQRIAVKSRELMPMGEVMHWWDQLLGRVVIELCGLPARCSRELGIRRDIEREVDAMRQRLADYFGEMARKVRGEAA